MRENTFLNEDLEQATIDLTRLLSLIWKSKALVLCVTIVSALLSIAVALWLPNIYESKARLAPKNDDGSGGLAGLAAQYGGLASLAGINLGSTSSGSLPKSTMALEKIKSLAFFEQYLYDATLLNLMAADHWNRSSNTVIYDTELYDLRLQRWVREVNFPRRVKPSAQEAHEEFLELLTVTEDKQTGVVIIGIEHKSPYVAKEWLDLLLASIDLEVRSADVREARDSVLFLTEQREATTLVALDEVFAQLIEEQTKKIMLANVSKDYVFEVIDPPVAAEFKSAPNRPLVCAIGTLFGFMLSVLVVLTRYYVGGRLSPSIPS